MKASAFILVYNNYAMPSPFFNEIVYGTVRDQESRFGAPHIIFLWFVRCKGRHNAGAAFCRKHLAYRRYFYYDI